MKIDVYGIYKEDEFIGYVSEGVCSKSIMTIFKYLRSMYNITSYSDFAYHDSTSEDTTIFWLDNWDNLTLDINKGGNNER